MRKKLKFKKLLNEFRSLSSELKFVSNNIRDINLEFERYYRDYCRKNDIDLLDLEKDNSQKVSGLFQSKSVVTKIAEKIRSKDYDHKLVYKEIAKKLHPDKLSSDDPRLGEFEEAFKKANQANAYGNWGDLFDIADKYDIDIKNYDDANKSIKDDIIRVKKELSKHKSTYGWQLFECEPEECKQNVVKAFLKHLFNI